MSLPAERYKTKPYFHQLDCLVKHGKKEAFALLAEMGTGKTWIIINNVAELWADKEINGVLVFAPNGVHVNWTNIELPLHTPDWVRYRMAAWSSSPTKKEKEKIEALYSSVDSSELRIFVMNWEALQTEKGFDAAKKFCLSCSKLMIACDETTMVKNPSADRTKALMKLKKYSSYRRIMNGTPVTNSPFDLFSQFSFLDEEILQTTSYYAFKAEYAELLKEGHHLIDHIIKKKTKFKPEELSSISQLIGSLREQIYSNGRLELIEAFCSVSNAQDSENFDSIPEELERLQGLLNPAPSPKKTKLLQTISGINSIIAGHMRRVSAASVPSRLPAIVARNKDGSPRYKNLEKLEALIAPHSYRVLKKDCLDLPEKIYKTIFYKMTAAQRKAYDLMKEENRMLLEGEDVPVPNKLVALGKIAQIVSGYYISPNDKEPIRIEGGTPKIDILVDTVERVVEQGKKVIVWARFHIEIDDIVGALKTKGFKVAQYDGRISSDNREQAKIAFQNGEVDVFVGQQQSGGVGITLTAASVVIYFSNTFSLYNRLQSEDRAHRIGQKEDVVYIDLVAENSIEEKTLAALRAKKNIADIITGDGAMEIL